MTNVILLVWDACRLDVSESSAPYLSQLATENIKFTNATAPADYSMPSHVSIFNKKYTYEHGCCSPQDFIGGENIPLISELDDNGFSTYAVSANKFAGTAYGFDEPFDEFYDTYPSFAGGQAASDGLDVGELITKTEESSTLRRYAAYLNAAATDERPIKSLYNLGISFVRELSRNVDILRHRGPYFHYNSLYRYTPGENTRRIGRILEQQTDHPFFVFSNYIDTHRPYLPPKESQRAVFGDTLSLSEVERLNETVAHPWAFCESVATGTVDEADVELVRDIYAAEVHSVDRHLRALMDRLEEQNLREETLVIVTADHGENLGETDVRGERRMGHNESFTEALFNVPLVMIHPEFDSEVVRDRMSLKSLYDVCRNPDAAVDGSLHDYIRYASTADPVIAECPANDKRPNVTEEYPDVPESTPNRMNDVDTAIAYTPDWKVVTDSEGNVWAMEGGEPVSADEAPRSVVDTCREHVEKMKGVDAGENLDDMDQQTIRQLEELGYL